MALKINKLPRDEVTGEPLVEPPGLVSDRNLYLDESKQHVLEEEDPNCRWVLVGAGGTIPAAEAERLGLLSKDGRIIQSKKLRPTVQGEPPAAGE